jgi:hypothetical protein
MEMGILSLSKNQYQLDNIYIEYDLIINKQKIQYNNNKKKFNFDDLAKYLLVLRFDKHLLSSMINHEYYQKLSTNKK